MKKILLATSILAATTGYAAAEVALTGDARMGVVYDGKDIQFSERARVRFNLSGQTDTGLEFGASFRAHESNDAQKGGWQADAYDREGTVWISGAFGKLEMGDVNSAAEAAFGDLSGVGFTGLNDYADIPYISGDGTGPIDQGPGALYSYSTGAFEFHLSMTDGNYVYGTPDEIQDNTDSAYAVAAAYSAGDYKVGVGYLHNGTSVSYTDEDDNTVGANDGKQVIVFGEADFAGVGMKAYYSDFKDMDEDKGYGFSLDYTFGATTVTGFATRMEFTEVSGEDDADSFGLGAAYDLGGGASVVGGVVDTDYIGDSGETIADIGIKLAF